MFEKYCTVLHTKTIAIITSICSQFIHSHAHINLGELQCNQSYFIFISPNIRFNLFISIWLLSQNDRNGFLQEILPSIVHLASFVGQGDGPRCIRLEFQTRMAFCCSSNHQLYCDWLHRLYNLFLRQFHSTKLRFICWHLCASEYLDSVLGDKSV